MFKYFGALSLNGRVPNCQLGRSQFESGRAREFIKQTNLIGSSYTDISHLQI